MLKIPKTIALSAAGLRICLGLKLDKIGVTDPLIVVDLELALALVLKELDRFEYDLPRAFIG